MCTNQVRASHILIKHQGSRRKASWKDPEGRVILNTTRDSAVAQLKALRDEIVSGKAKFDDIASRYSDCSSAKRGGDLDFSWNCNGRLCCFGGNFGAIERKATNRGTGECSIFPFSVFF
ncbi:Peptidyl-prolyl cis-trans isomerase [Macleaya cordata]|uniref:Peptidyl-prolyl cis-trans isomerase n=1 Tax=Macleaya cordata TaxID=56857 RepID=A0A200QQ63_MACCD|nr:Peptidyl-prolyl cis-trans isomerase [Macleaya cordata]